MSSATTNRESPVQFRPGKELREWLESQDGRPNEVARQVVVLACFQLPASWRGRIAVTAGEMRETFDAVCERLAGELRKQSTGGMTLTKYRQLGPTILRKIQRESNDARKDSA